RYDAHRPVIPGKRPSRFGSRRLVRPVAPWANPGRPRTGAGAGAAIAQNLHWIGSPSSWQRRGGHGVQDTGAIIHRAQADSHRFGLDRGLRLQAIGEFGQVLVRPFTEAPQFVAALDRKSYGILESHGITSKKTCTRAARRGAERAGPKLNRGGVDDPGAALAYPAGRSTRQLSCLAEATFKTASGCENRGHAAIIVICRTLSNCRKPVPRAGVP